MHAIVVTVCKVLIYYGAAVNLSLVQQLNTCANLCVMWFFVIYCTLLFCVAACCLVIFIRLKRSIASDDVYAFGYNSAESEPIWMKSGAL